jgi:hypothetical protein
MTEFAGRMREISPSSSPQRTPRVRPAYAADMVFGPWVWLWNLWPRRPRLRLPRPAYASDAFLGLEVRDILTLLGILCGFAVQYGMFSARLRTQEELLREVRTKLFNGINAQIGALQTGLGEMKATCHARHEEKR